MNQRKNVSGTMFDIQNPAAETLYWDELKKPVEMGAKAPRQDE